MSDLKLVVLVDRDDERNIDDVADDLSKVGFKVDRKMSVTGIISGTASPENLEDLRKVKGVTQLREETTFSHPPMEDDVPQ